MKSTFKITPNENELIEKAKKRAIEELNIFFKRESAPDPINILLVETRETYNFLSHRETEMWEAGFIFNFNSIVLLDPANLEQESAHKYSEEEYSKMVKHEICHLYFSATFGKCPFKWIEEGIPVYLSKQGDPVKNFSGFLQGDNLYIESGYAFKLLVEKFGEEKLFEFLKRQSGMRTQQELEKAFYETYGSPLGYEFFNDLLNTN